MVLLFLVTFFLFQTWCESLKHDKNYPCRVYPGNVSYPTDSDLVSFARQLKGYILTPRNGSLYDVANQVYNRNMKQRPALIVRAKSIQDVQRVILFSRRYNLHLTIRSSGHDFIGRNSHDGSINLDMSELKEVTVNLNSGRNKAGEVTAQSGASWADVYKEVDKALGPDDNGKITGRVVVGGYCSAVAMGGYGQGGGHSPIGRKHGLAVDSLLSVTMVTVDGKIRTVNATHVVTYEFDGTTSVSNDTELFWALRGGGGGTWGVVFSYTYKLHYPPQRIRRLTVVILLRDLFGRDINKEVVKLAFQKVNQLSHDWGGYIVLSEGSVVRILKSLLPAIPDAVLALLPSGLGYSVMVMLMNHVGDYFSPSNSELDALTRVPGVISFNQYLPSYWSFVQTSLNYPYADSYTFGNLIQPHTLSDPGSLSGFVDLMLEMAKNGTFVTATLIGGNMAKAEKGSTAVNEALRQGIICVGCFHGFPLNGHKYDPQELELILARAERLYTFSNACYVNEPAEHLPRWKQMFWDLDTYARLLPIKMKVDPTNYLWCHNCVGSDLGENYENPNQTCAPGEPAYSPTLEHNQAGSTFGKTLGDLLSFIG